MPPRTGLAGAQGLAAPGLLPLSRAALGVQDKGCLCGPRPGAAARKERDKVLLFCFGSSLEAPIGCW